MSGQWRPPRSSAMPMTINTWLLNSTARHVSEPEQLQQQPPRALCVPVAPCCAIAFGTYTTVVNYCLAAKSITACEYMYYMYIMAGIRHCFSLSTFCTSLARSSLPFYIPACAHTTSRPLPAHTAASLRVLIAWVLLFLLLLRAVGQQATAQSTAIATPPRHLRA